MSTKLEDMRCRPKKTIILLSGHQPRGRSLMWLEPSKCVAGKVANTLTSKFRDELRCIAIGHADYIHDFRARQLFCTPVSSPVTRTLVYVYDADLGKESYAHELKHTSFPRTHILNSNAQSS